jgi:integrase
VVAKSNVEVSRQTIDAVLKHCDTTWATIVALSRFGGLRCPSETLSLKWGDIDWENDRMAVPEPKVEHHEGRGVRSVPIFAELRWWLEAAWNAASDGTKYPSPESYVIDKPAYRAAAMREGGWANANLRTQFLKILKRAGVPAWNRLFHSMRATRQTELGTRVPFARGLCVAWEHRSDREEKLPAGDRRRLPESGPKSGAECGALIVKTGAKCGAASFTQTLATTH